MNKLLRGKYVFKKSGRKFRLNADFLHAIINNRTNEQGERDAKGQIICNFRAFRRWKRNDMQGDSGKRKHPAFGFHEDVYKRQEVAILEGSNLIRVGTAIFGERDYSKQK